MNYFINAISWRNLSKLPIDVTDFTDFQTCFNLLEGLLRLNTASYLTIRLVIEDDNPDLDETLVIQYHYAEPGRIAVAISDENENILHQDYLLFLKEDGKIAGANVLEDTPEERDEIVKIILEYGGYACLGVQWALFLLKERHDGTLEQYFDDLYTQEIH